MADGANAVTIRTVGALADIGRRRWNELAARADASHNPFTSFEFLNALEESGSAAPSSGWAPMHLVIEERGALLAAAPLYLKSHSQGEYVFDHHWADALERAGGRYYPKLVCAVPFTPVPGPRLLAPDRAAAAALGAGMIEAARQIDASSAHINFIRQFESEALAAAGYLPRRGLQYHWFNRGYDTFDDFLATLSSRKRKTIRRERREARESGLVIRRLRGDAIEERHWEAFWTFYQDTGSRKWGRPYLSRRFFDLVAERMADRALLIVAEQGDRIVAGALNFIGGDALFGRYWGCIEFHAFLHFELCYHQAIEFAIEHRLQRVEAGAQGEHKVARGYEPVETFSAHWIADPGFRDAIARYLERERTQNSAEMDMLQNFTPYRKA